MEDTKKKSYKYCIVPMCPSTTVKTPDKLFFYVPFDIEKRKTWCKLMNRSVIGPKSNNHVCEDHFDVENDAENLLKYRLVGARLKLKPNVYPHKFACQQHTHRQESSNHRQEGEASEIRENTRCLERTRDSLHTDATRARAAPGSRYTKKSLNSQIVVGTMPHIENKKKSPALTNAERQRRHREKKKARRANEMNEETNVFEMPSNNAVNCKNYRIRKKAATVDIKKIKKTTLTSAERSRMYRLRKKEQTQGIESSVIEVLYTPSTSNSLMTFEPSPQPVITMMPGGRPRARGAHRTTSNRLSRTANRNRQRIRRLLDRSNDPPVPSLLDDTTPLEPSDTGIEITIKNEMDDVKEQTHSQTNIKIDKTLVSNESVRNRRVNELDKFKRRMIRAIARLLYTERKAEPDIWEDLKAETGCDCELLWSRMRALTIKKLVRLFTAEDKIQNISKIVQLSVTDWLLYDLVLVHEKVDVIGQKLYDKEEPAFLRDLFDLVEEYNIEDATGEELCEKWFEATAKYNNTGKRQCSPMLLQKRWYQLKERSRSNFYNFWFQYRGDSRKLEKANEFKPSELQLDIVKRYKELVTKPFLSWEVLIKERRVALPEDFERLRLARNKIMSESEPDLEVIEPHVETIDLEETNDPDDPDDPDDPADKDADNNELNNEFNIDIVKIESLAEQDDVSVLESVHIPLEKSESIEINNSVHVEATKNQDDNDLEIIESDSESIMPKIESVTSTAHLKSDKDDTEAKSKKVVNIILEQIVNNVLENKITNLDEKIATTSKENVLNLDKDIDQLRSNVNIDIDKEIKEIDFQEDTKNVTKIEEKYELSKDIGFDDFSNNLNFIDDGIEFIDDGIEYMDEDCIPEYNVKPEIKSEMMEAANEEEPKIDLKLLLTPVVYTMKLDDMDVFRFIDYNTVKDDRVIQNAARESKPEDRKSVNMKEMFQECHEDTGDVESDSDDLVDSDIAMSSWLFRKPKVNSYNPIQLCKNPDFNTRLKRLAAAFYTSERNRLLLKECNPLTVDLHKAFESKLINNTLYLKKTKKDSDSEILDEVVATCCKTDLPESHFHPEIPEMTMEPGADDVAADQQMSTEQTSEIHTERNKVINLPDKEQIRRVNQGLLVAEVSPIQVSNPLNQTNNVLNTVIEPETKLTNSTTDQEFTEIPASACQFSLETDKVITVPESHNSVLTDSINIDIEQNETETLSKHIDIHGAKNDDGQNKQSLLKQSIPKPKSRTITKKYMALSWLNKVQAIRTGSMDCLLAADTVEKILSLCKDDYISPDPKVCKPKKKKKKEPTVKNIPESQEPAAIKKSDIQKKVSENETEIPKKSKCRTSITAQTTNAKNVCCWSRKKIENFNKLNTGKHLCLYNQCVCCCKADLEAKILAIEQQRKRCEPIILSDDESITMPPAKQHKPVSKVTVGTNTDYDKDFEDQFAANLSMFKDNANQVYTPTISIPLSGLPQTFSNESGCQTLTPFRVVKHLPPATRDKNITAASSTPKNRAKGPISLGKNKILLCSFKTTTGPASVRKVIKCNQNNQSEHVLPEGCHLVLLPNRELALSIDPGLELDPNQLSNLPSLIAAVQKQIKIIPTSETIDQNNVTSNEETVIHLSDDEKPSIKDNVQNNLNMNDTSTSNSLPEAMNLDDSNANTVSHVDDITKEENYTPSIDTNNLSNPKESCNIPTYVTNNSTTNVDVIIESSDNEISGKDTNSEEVIDNSTNNTEGSPMLTTSDGVNKKTILSDLMEMSGISTDDITTNNDGSVPSSEVSCATNNESISIIQQVLSESDSSAIDLQREYGNITKGIGINVILNNIVVRAALLRCPELNIVSSFPELKFAYKNGAQFFKMDVMNGIIVPINVCIKQDFDGMRLQRIKGISQEPKSVIDLTEDNENATCSSNLPIQSKMSITKEVCNEASQDIQSNKNISPLKPIKMFKAIHPSILRRNGKSLLVRAIKSSTGTQNKLIGVTKYRRKQGLHFKKIFLDGDKKLKIENSSSNKMDSDAESDEEPLAKKAKRLKKTDNEDNDPSLDLDGKGIVAEDMNELPPRLEPIVFEYNSDQSSGDDCILGV